MRVIRFADQFKNIVTSHGRADCHRQTTKSNVEPNGLGGIQNTHGFYSDGPDETEVRPITHSLNSDYNDQPYKVRCQRQAHRDSTEGEENCLVYLDVVISDAFTISYGDEKKT